MEDVEERVLHDTAPNSDQEEDAEAQAAVDLIANSPTLMNHNVNMELPSAAVSATDESPEDQHDEPMDQQQPDEHKKLVSDSCDSSEQQQKSRSASAAGDDSEMLCCANIRINSPHFFSGGDKSKHKAKQKQLAEQSRYQSESSIGACSSSTTTDSPVCSLRETRSLSRGSSPSLPSVDKARPLTPVTRTQSLTADRYSTELSVNTNTPPSNLLSSAPEINSHSFTSDAVGLPISSSSHRCSSASSTHRINCSASVSVPTVNTSTTNSHSISSGRNETTPVKICHRSNTLPSHGTNYPTQPDLDLSASSELLVHKRKSEAERELSSPGKRVRGMSEATNASMILHSQTYMNHSSAVAMCSPSSTQYGHFQVSPQTPSSRRRSSCKVNNKPPPPQLDSWLRMFMAWDSADKTYALNQLIDVCDPAHVRHIMAVIEPQFQRDFISLLPKELALYVLSFLTPKDLLRAGQTCQYWRTLTEDTLLWKQKCKESGADLGMMYKTLDWSDSQINDESIDWKSLYLKTYTVEHHWRHGEVKPTKMLRGHDDHVITCLEFCGNRIVSGSDDNTLKVWDVDTGMCLRTLVGHTGGVWSSQMKDNIVISGSTDRTLRVWDTETGECLHTLQGHTSTVRCMHLHNSIVVSGSRDATLRMWDIHRGECVHVLIGHVAAVRCVQYDGHRVVSGAYDYTVRVWDPHTESCIHVLQGHTNRVYSLQFDGKHIVSGSLDTSIRVWDADSGECLHTLTGHQSLTSGMEIRDGLLVSGNADSTVKVWDINSGACLQTLTGTHKHQGAVTCLQFTRKFVVTSSDDGTVKLWSLQTGEFIRNLVSLESGGSGGVVWRVKADNSLLVCASGSRNGTEDTKLIVIDFGLTPDMEDMLASSHHTSQQSLLKMGSGLIPINSESNLS